MRRSAGTMRKAQPKGSGTKARGIGVATSRFLSAWLGGIFDAKVGCSSLNLTGNCTSNPVSEIWAARSPVEAIATAGQRVMVVGWHLG